MITWLQTFFLKHNKWLFSALLVVIIVTFVLTIGNQSFFGGQAGMTQAERRDYYGYDLNNPAEMERIMLHGEISAMLQPELGVQGPAVQQFAIVRVAALGLANDLSIASPSDEQVRRHLESLMVFQSEETEQFDPARFSEYREFITARLAEGERTLARVLREDVRIAQVRDALAGPGYLIPSVIEDDFVRAETRWEVQIAQRRFNEFEIELSPTSEQLEAFYEQDPSRFEVPERIHTSVARFHAEAFLTSINEPTEAELQNHFNRFRFRYQPESANDDDTDTEVTLDDVRDRVVTDVRRESARLRAQSASEDFLTQLYEQGIPRDDPEFDALLRSSGGRLEPMPPYSRNNPPRHGQISAEIFRSMWMYTTGDRYYSDLAPAPEGAALLIFEEVVPAHIPPYAEITAQVESAWTAETRREQFAAAAQQWENEIRDAVAAGTEFVDAAAEAGFTVDTPEPFSGNHPANALFEWQLADELQALEPSETSPVIVSQNGAALVFVINKEQPEVDANSDEFTAFVEQELETRRHSNGWAALSAWTDRTLAIATPEMRRER